PWVRPCVTPCCGRAVPDGGPRARRRRGSGDLRHRHRGCADGRWRASLHGVTARHPCEPGAPPASPRVRVVDRERLSPALAAGAADEAAGRALGAALEAALGRLVAL